MSWVSQGGDGVDTGQENIYKIGKIIIRRLIMLHKIGWWIFDNIPLGKLAPHFFGWLIGSKPVKIKDGKK